MDPFCGRVWQTIERYNMLGKKERVVVAVSGGPDSTALLYALLALAGENNWSLFVAHINHGLRGADAREDAEYVRRLAEALNLPFYLHEVDVGDLARQAGVSVEEAGRIARYDFLGDLARQLGAKIAVGHNRDDQAETVLMNFLRGSGMRGLTGIPPVRGNIIRPLIRETRGEIEEFCRRMGITPRLDVTNLGTDFLRNRIRNDLIPFLEKEYNPLLKEALFRMADILRHEDEVLDDVAEKASRGLVRKVKIGGSGFELERSELLNLPLALQRRIVRKLFLVLAGGELDYELTEAALASAARKDPNQVSLPLGFIVSSRYGKVFLGRQECSGRWASAQVEKGPVLLNCGVTDVDDLHIVLTKRAIPATVNWKSPAPYEMWVTRGKWYGYMDLDRVIGPVRLRFRRPGDVFQPVGMKGSKKLKDYFIDRKVPPILREQMPLLVDDNGIIAVVGMDISERVKVTDMTRDVIVTTVSKRRRKGESGRFRSSARIENEEGETPR